MTLETTSQKPRLRELMTFVLAGPPIGTLLVGLALHRTIADLFIGFAFVFSPIMPLCYIFGMPGALCAGIAWQMTRWACWEKEEPYKLKAFVTIILIGVVVGLLPAMMFVGPTYSGSALLYMLHGAITAGLCGWLAQKLWIRTPVTSSLVTATE